MLAARVITGVVSPSIGALPSSYKTIEPLSSTNSVMVGQVTTKGSDSDANPTKTEKATIAYYFFLIGYKNIY